MNKLVRAALLIVAFIIYFGVIFVKLDPTNEVGFRVVVEDPVNMIGFIILVGLLLVSMEGVRRKRDKNFTIQSQAVNMDELKQHEFVMYIAELFKRMGYYVRPLATQVDEGADLVVRKGKQVICIRCGIKGTDSLALLREVYGSMSYHKANKSLVVINDEVGEAAERFAKTNHVQMIDRGKLIQMLQQVILKDDRADEKLTAVMPK